MWEKDDGLELMWEIMTIVLLADCLYCLLAHFDEAWYFGEAHMAKITDSGFQLIAKNRRLLSRSLWWLNYANSHKSLEAGPSQTEHLNEFLSLTDILIAALWDTREPS